MLDTLGQDSKAMRLKRSRGIARGAQQEPQREFTNTAAAQLFLSGLQKTLRSLFFEGRKMEKEEGKEKQRQKERRKERREEGRKEQGRERGRAGRKKEGRKERRRGKKERKPGHWSPGLR